MEIRIQTDRQKYGGCAVKRLDDVMNAGGDEQALLFSGFVFGICFKGNAVVRINGTGFETVSGNVFVVLPKHVFSVVSHSDDIDMKLIYLSLDFIRKLPVSPNFESMKSALANPCIEIGEWAADLSSLCNIILRRNYAWHNGEAIQMSLVSSIALILSDLYENRPQNARITLSRQEVLTNKFFELLLQYFESERSVAFYADRLCVTPKYLSVAIRSVSGCSVQKWINEIVLAEAKRYLCTTEMTIQQISDKLNFASPSSFIRFFRQHMLTTPLAYRKD